MSKQIKGIVIQIDGETTGFDKAMKNVKSEAASTKNELKEVNKLLKLDPKNTELLAQKQQFLAKRVEESAKKLDILRQAEVQMSKELENGKGDQTKYNKLQRDLVYATKEFKNAENAAKNYNKTLESAGLQMQNFGEKATKAGQALLPLSAGAGLILTGAVAAGMELEAMQAKYTTVFAGYTDISDEFIAKFQELTPATEAQSQAMASGIQDLLVPMGFAREEATNMTGEFFHVIGALTNFNSGTETAETVTAKFQAAITGEVQGLKSIGIQLDEETIKRKAVEMGLASSTNEVTKQAKAQVILAESYNQSKDALNAYNEENLDAKTKLNLFKAELTDLLAELGESLLPILNSLIDLARGIVKSFDGMSDGGKKLIVAILALITALGPLLIGIGQMSIGLGALITNIPKVAGLFTSLFGLFKTGAAGVGVAGAVAGASSPVGLIILGLTLISLLIAALWGNIDIVIAKFKQFWEWILKVKDALKDLFTEDNMDKYSLAVQSGQREAKTSRFSGLSYVPFDNFMVEAHKGERILTREENKIYTQNQNNSQSTINITVEASNIKELNDLIRIAENSRRIERMS